MLKEGFIKLLRKFTKPEVCISCAGIIVLGALYIFWCCDTSGRTVCGYIASFVSVVLFAAVCLRFVPVWIGAWKRDIGDLSFSGLKPDAADEKSEIKRTSVWLFFSFIAVNSAVIVLVYLMRCAHVGNTSFAEYLNFWKVLDSGHYLAIAEDWYLSEGEWDRLVQLVFLPGYPVCIKIVNYIVNNYLYSGLIVSSLCFGAAGAVFYRLLRLDFSKKDSLRAIKYMWIFPGAFFFAAPMSESLFLLMSLLCVYSVRRRKWLLSCLAGFYAAFTRSLGIILIVPVFFEIICSLRENTGEKRDAGKVQRGILKFSSLFVIAAGFGAYCLINYFVSGEPMKFTEYQEVHWGQSLGFFFNTAAYQFENLIRTFAEHSTNALGLWLPNVLVCFISLVIMLCAVKKIHPCYTAYFLAYYFVAVGTTWLLSAPRYMAALFPLPIALTALTKKRVTDIAVTSVCGLLYVLYIYAFIMRWQVW